MARVVGGLLLALIGVAALSVASTARADNGHVFQTGFAAVGGHAVPLYVVMTNVPPLAGATLPGFPRGLRPLDARLTGSQAHRLAVYIVPGVGILLAPLGMREPHAASIGADGNARVTLSDGRTRITLKRVPACVWCAYAGARAWLPWVRPMPAFCKLGKSSCGELRRLPGEKLVRITKHIAAVRYVSGNNGEVNGVVAYQSGRARDLYQSVWFHGSGGARSLATVILNFALRYDVYRNPYVETGAIRGHAP